MKAYKVRITIDETYPEIWREAVIPAGITFSQLSLVLDEILGYDCRGDYFFYEILGYSIVVKEECAYGFEDNEYCVVEGKYDEYDGFSFLPSEETLINQFMEETDEIVYTLDEWDIYIDVLERYDDFELKSPYVITYRGSIPIAELGCPEEWDYILNAAKHEDDYAHESSLEFMNSIKKYDKKKINRELEKFFFLIQSDKKQTGDKDSMYYEPFTYTENADPYIDLDAEYNVRALDADYDRDLLQEMFGDINFNFSLYDTLNHMAKNDLLDMAKILKFKKVSSLKKADLIKRIYSYLTDYENIRKLIMSMSEAEIRSIDNVIENGRRIYINRDDDIFDNLYKHFYSLMDAFDKVVLADEFREAYISIRSEEDFEEKHKKASYIACCIRTGLILYGIIPDYVFKKLIEANNELHYEEGEIQKIINNFSDEFRSKFNVNGLEITGVHASERPDYILEDQLEIPYYIPDLKHIISIGTYGYDIDIDIYAELLVALSTSYGHMNEVVYYVRQVINMLMRDYPVGAVIDYLDHNEVYIKDDCIESFFRIIHSAELSVRHLRLRGHTYDEANDELLKAEKYRFMDENRDNDKSYSNVIDFNTGKRIKL